MNLEVGTFARTVLANPKVKPFFILDLSHWSTLEKDYGTNTNQILGLEKAFLKFMSKLLS